MMISVLPNQNDQIHARQYSLVRSRIDSKKFEDCNVTVDLSDDEVLLFRKLLVANELRPFQGLPPITVGSQGCGEAILAKLHQALAVADGFEASCSEYIH
jgi:hypothetical protein